MRVTEAVALTMGTLLSIPFSWTGALVVARPTWILSFPCLWSRQDFLGLKFLTRP